MKIKSYKELDVWKKGIEIVDLVYEVTSRFPPEEKFGLAAHMQKTAVSIPSNIAEGFLRQYAREYAQFLHVALGSCGELETQQLVASRRGYIINNDSSRLEEMLDHEGRMLRNLIKSVKAL